MTTEIPFTHPFQAALRHHIENAAALGLPLVPKGRRADAPGAVVVGLGNSINDAAVQLEMVRLSQAGWVFIGIKESVAFLEDRGIAVAYAGHMDPGIADVGRTKILPHVTYCLASSCHPLLYEYYLNAGATVEVFHSACGCNPVTLVPGLYDESDASFELGRFTLPGEHGDFSPVIYEATHETAFYKALFGVGDTMEGGFTVANRLLALAKYMGFEKVTLAGVDFGWRPDNDAPYYAPGLTAAQPADQMFMSDGSQVDGREWMSRPDLVASAVHIARCIKNDEVSVLGDSLASALAKRDEAFLDRVATVKYRDAA